MSTTEDSSQATRGISRRRAVKVGAAVTVGVAVWTEPTIKGLAKRPAYAAANSSITPTMHDLVSLTSVTISSATTTTTTSDGLVDLTLQRVDDGEGIFYTLTAAVVGCTCDWIDSATVQITNGATTATGATGLDTTVIRFNWPDGFNPPTSLEVIDTITTLCTPI